MRRQAVTTSDWWEYQPGERVQTVDGYPGVVDAVEDGPAAGMEVYLVTLDSGLGGGQYSPGMLEKMPSARQASGVHLASEDYPELGDILDERPDPGKMTFTAALSEERQDADAEDHDEPDGDDQPHSCSYCGGTQFKDQTDNGRVRQATCAICGGTMSAHPGAQWTPELIGDPSNHPSPAVDPRSGASGAGGVAGINDFIDFDSRVSTTAALAVEHGISHVYRGVHGPFAAAAAEANRSGDLGSGMYGKGFYTTSSPDLATSYAQAHGGDRTGVFMHGQIHPDASVGHLDDVPKHIQHGTETDWAREHGHDVLTDGVHTHIVANPHAITWDPKNYDIGEARKKFNRWGEDYDPSPPDLHTAALAGHDWCTWRREARCTFPGDSTAVSLAIPQDRGPCPWETPWQQQVCPISEPGPMALMQAKGSLELPEEVGFEGTTAALEAHVAADDDDDYRMSHQAPGPDYGAPLHDVSAMMPDFYTHPHYYNHGQDHFHDSAGAIHSARDQPEKMVHVYRALPAEHAHKGIRPGDWVSTSKEYARGEGRMNNSKDDYPVIRARVPAKHLHTEGDVHEWGYNGPDTVHGMVVYKGGHNQEVRHNADGMIKQVQRRPKKEASDTTSAMSRLTNQLRKKLGPGSANAIQAQALVTLSASDEWFHGSRHVHQPGDVLTGGHAKSNQGYGQPADHVYYSGRRDVASYFAEAGNGPDHDPDARPRVYRVQPVEGHEQDPDEDKQFHSFRAPKVKVLGEAPFDHEGFEKLHEGGD